MRRFLISAMIVIPFFCFSLALAGCSDHPDDDNFSRSYLLFDEPWNETFHLSYYVDEVVCATCSIRISGGEYPVHAPHDYLDDGSCLFCGYKQSNAPTHAELHRRAFLLLASGTDEIHGQYASVIHEGHIYAEPSVTAEIVGSVVPGEIYLIENHQAATSEYVWLKIQHTNGTGWVPAGLVSLSDSQTPAVVEDTESADTTEADPYIGRICKIKVSSGRGRAMPGTDSKVVSYVGFGEIFTIHGSQYIEDGSLWLMIETTNGTCWIAAGLANIY